MIPTPQIYGSYLEPDEQVPYIKMDFLLGQKDVNDRWSNNDLSANFLAAYLPTLLAAKGSEHRLESMAETQEMVSYVANELLENTMKYSNKLAEYEFDIGLYLHDNHLRIYVNNPVLDATLPTFQSWINLLLAANPHELQLKQIRQNVDGSTGRARLGYLTMLTGYQATLAWKFVAFTDTSNLVEVTTLAQLPI